MGWFVSLNLITIFKVDNNITTKEQSGTVPLAKNVTGGNYCGAGWSDGSRIVNTVPLFTLLSTSIVPL